MQIINTDLSNFSHQILLSVLNANYDMVCASYNKDSWTKPEEVRVRGFVPCIMTW